MTDNVKSLGPLYLTYCWPYHKGYHQTALFFFPRTREYEWPFRAGRGIGIRLPIPQVVNYDGHNFYRLTSRVFVLGLWFSSRKRKAWNDEQGILWALSGNETADDYVEIAEWQAPEPEAEEEWAISGVAQT